LAVKLFWGVVVLRREVEVDCRVKEDVRGMKNKAIEKVMNKIIHSPRNAKKVVAAVLDVKSSMVERFGARTKRRLKIHSRSSQNAR